MEFIFNEKILILKCRIVGDIYLIYFNMKWNYQCVVYYSPSIKRCTIKSNSLLAFPLLHLYYYVVSLNLESTFDWLIQICLVMLIKFQSLHIIFFPCLWSGKMWSIRKNSKIQSMVGDLTWKLGPSNWYK